jgi:hypothetical protein
MIRQASTRTDNTTYHSGYRDQTLDAASDPERRHDLLGAKVKEFRTTQCRFRTLNNHKP